MKRIEIRHRVEKQREGTYYAIPFSVPEGIVKLTVSYRYDKITQGLTGHRKTANIIDLGLQDAAGRFLGWSGSAKESVSVGEYSSEKGYFSEPIQPGLWQILIGAYKINGLYTDVVYTIELEERQSRFYFGDLHVHSEASDGKYSAWQLAQKAMEAGLDFLALADHNNYSENFHLPSISDFTFIPAVEWTHYKGHMNLFGARAPFDNGFIANTAEQMRQLLSRAKELGAYVSVNHPKCSVCPYLWQDDTAFDWMEIWNGPMRPANWKALAWWTELLSGDRKIPIVAGSDYHKGNFPVQLGHPLTAVYSDSPAAEALLEALAKGHSYITSGVKGAKLQLSYGEQMMGDTISVARSAELLVCAQVPKGQLLQMVTARGVRTLDLQNGRATVTVSKKEKFAYLKAVLPIGGGNLFTAVSNPIYFADAQ